MLEYPEILEIWRTLTTSFANAVMLELKQEQMTIAGRTFRFKQFVKGERPAQGYTLIFGLHGGGGCPF